VTGQSRNPAKGRRLVRKDNNIYNDENLPQHLITNKHSLFFRIKSTYSLTVIGKLFVSI